MADVMSYKKEKARTEDYSTDLSLLSDVLKNSMNKINN